MAAAFCENEAIEKDRGAKPAAEMIGGKMKRIKKIAIQTAATQGLRKMSEYLDRINQAFLMAEGPLDVTIKHRFDAYDEKIKIETFISFVESRVKDSEKVMLDPNQKPLPGFNLSADVVVATFGREPGDETEAA